MASETMRKCAALLLMVLVPAAVMAGDWDGTVTTSSGIVNLNGQAIRGSHILMPGDLIKTAKGRAMVRLSSGSVAIAENTNARFEKSAVLLNNGFSEVSGNKDLTARYRDLTIHSVGSEQATFVVGEMQGKPTVATLQGIILVSDGNGSVILPAGRAIAAVNDEDNNDNPSAASGQQEGRPAEPAVKGGHGSKNDDQRGGKRNKRMLAGWEEAAILAGLIGGTLGALGAAGVFSAVSNQTIQGPIIP